MAKTMMLYPGLGVPQKRIPETPQRDSKLEEALQQYHRFCAHAENKQDVWTAERTYFDARERITTALNPLYINLFLAEITPETEHPFFKSIAVTVLINNAYVTGINTFDITILDYLETSSFGAQLCGTEEQPYNLRIKGNLGFSSFYHSKHVNAIIKGTCGNDTAKLAEYVNLECEEMSCDLGYHAANSIFRFHHINKEIISRTAPLNLGILTYAQNCTIQFYEREDFNLLTHLYVPKGQGNKIQLVKKGSNAVIDEVQV